MNRLACPRCGHTNFEVRVTASSVDFDVDVAAESQFLINRSVIDEPDTLDVEAECRNCAHARYVPRELWEWA